MKKTRKYTLIVTLFFALLFAISIPMVSKAQNSIPTYYIGEIKLNATGLIPPLDGDVASTDNLPVFTVVSGDPAYVSLADSYWEKYIPSTGTWEKATQGHFGSTLWRFKTQIRVDNYSDTENWKLNNNCDVYVNSEYAGTLTGLEEFPNGSYAYFTTKVATLTRPVTVNRYNADPLITYHPYGKTVYISTDIPEGYVFDRWECSPPNVPFSVSSASTSFVMPDEALELTPTFRPIDTYGVQIEHHNSANSEKTFYPEGETVYLTTSIPDHYVFDHWDCTSETLSFDANSLETSFVMPAEDLYFSPVFHFKLDINEANFPDPVFREYVKTFDTGRKGYFNEDDIFSITTMDCSNQSIHDLTGIENFIYLKELYCQDNELMNLTIKLLTNLETLDCSNNHLVSLSLDENKKLSNITLSGNTRKVTDNTPISEFDSFELSRITGKKSGGYFENDQVHFNKGSDQFYYYYKCSENNSMKVTLYKDQPKYTGQWLYQNEKWWYRHDSDGSYTTNDFEEIDGIKYYFDGSGYMVTGWKWIENHWHYFNGSGVMVTGWQTIDSDEYYFYSDGSMASSTIIDDKFISSSGAVVYDQWVYSSYAGAYWYQFADGSYPHDTFLNIDGYVYYFDENGYMLTGWQLINNKYYYFNGSGHMLTGWQTIDSDEYFFYPNGVMASATTIDGKFISSSGAVVYDQWVYSSYAGAYWYQFIDGSYPHDTFLNIDGYVYYFDSNGYMLTGWQWINNYYYYFNGSGHMLTGWQTIGSDKYFFYPDGVMASSTTIDNIVITSSGAALKGNWVYSNYAGAYWYQYEDGTYPKNALYTIDDHVYYFDANGYMLTGWQYLYNHYYYFDDSGHMLTGWHWINGSCYYFYIDGTMAHDTIIDGSTLDSSGAWVA